MVGQMQSRQLRSSYVCLGTGRGYISDQPQTALFTGLQGTLLQILGPGNTALEPASSQALRWFTYGSIIFNLGASTSAVFCLIIFSDISTHARTRAINPDLLPGKVLREKFIDTYYLRVENEEELLREFGMNPVCRQARLHMLWCFVLGALCTFIDIGIWACTKETISLRIAILVFLGIVGLPLGYVLFRLIRPPATLTPLVTGRHSSTSIERKA